MLHQAFGDEALGRTQCFEWHSHFRRGQTLAEDKRSGQPGNSTTPENVKKTVTNRS